MFGCSGFASRACPSALALRAPRILQRREQPKGRGELVHECPANVWPPRLRSNAAVATGLLHPVLCQQTSRQGHAATHELSGSPAQAQSIQWQGGRGALSDKSRFGRGRVPEMGRVSAQGRGLCAGERERGAQSAGGGAEACRNPLSTHQPPPTSEHASCRLCAGIKYYRTLKVHLRPKSGAGALRLASAASERA